MTGWPEEEITTAQVAQAIAGGVADLMRLNGTPHPKMWDVTVEASYDALLRLLDWVMSNSTTATPESSCSAPTAAAWIWMILPKRVVFLEAVLPSMAS